MPSGASGSGAGVVAGAMIFGASGGAVSAAGASGGALDSACLWQALSVKRLAAITHKPNVPVWILIWGVWKQQGRLLPCLFKGLRARTIPNHYDLAIEFLAPFCFKRTFCHFLARLFNAKTQRSQRRGRRGRQDQDSPCVPFIRRAVACASLRLCVKLGAFHAPGPRAGKPPLQVNPGNFCNRGRCRNPCFGRIG